MNKNELLYRIFGYSSFRSGQEKLIDAVLSGQDVFGIMPTGGGKSICYQIPYFKRVYVLKWQGFRRKCSFRP